MRPTGSPETLEARRKIAARLFERGMPLTEVAAVVGSSVSSAYRWRNAWRHGSKLRVQASSRQDAQAFSPTTDRIGRCIDARHTVLGLCARWLDRTVGAGHDPATVRRGFSSGVCAAVAASVGLESAEARAASPGTQRSGHCPLASRHLAATKKRASNVKLAWFLSMKVAFCCNRCGDECGHRQATRPFSVPGTDAIASRRSPPSHARRGRCGWDCTTNSWITMRGPRISFALCAMSMGICAVQSFWCGIACLLIAPPPDDSLRRWLLASGRMASAVCADLDPVEDVWNQSKYGPWRTSFLRTFKICTPNSIRLGNLPARAQSPAFVL